MYILNTVARNKKDAIQKIKSDLGIDKWMSGPSKLRNISQLRQSYISLSSVLASVVLL